jgi:lambda repressor-like predicted transcriptional regulator
VSAELISQANGAARAGTPAAASPQRAAARPVRPVIGVLADGTVCFAPVGEVVVDGALVVCHLCGRSFRSVAAHLNSHGWTKERYCDAFGLERGQSLESDHTRKLRAAALAARLLFEPAMREGSAAGRARARAGLLTADAAAAARGRSFPQQRRKKAAAARTKNPSASVAKANRDRARQRLVVVAAAAAERLGYADIGALVADRTRQGSSLAAISREAGLHKDWLARHLRTVDPVAAQVVAQAATEAVRARWLPAVRALGYADLASYLRQRHGQDHQTVSAMAAELGVSRHAVQAALREQGVAVIAHAAKRHAADQRAAAVAAGLGFASVGDYISQRRAQGLTWRAIAAESGEPQTWLRRQAV